MNKKTWLRYFFVVFVCTLIIGINGCTKNNSKVFHIGILSGFEFFADVIEGFKFQMMELGYIEGKNVIYDIQKSSVDMDAYKKVVSKFVKDKVDLVFVFPSEASLAAKIVTKDTGVPVVFAIANVEELGLIDSVRKPGGNITGVRWPGPDIALKRFEIMHELMPKMKRIFIGYMKDYPIVQSQLDVLRPAAARVGVKLLEFSAKDPKDLRLILKKQAVKINSATDAMLIIVEPFSGMLNGFACMADFANEHSIPLGGIMYKNRIDDSIFGYIPLNVPVGKQSAFLADKILKGIPAGTLPVVSAESHFTFNYRAARKRGLHVSEGMLSRANEVIR